MTISDEAVEAAADAVRDLWDSGDPVTAEMEAHAALEAAAPYLRAQALEDAADDPELRLSGHSGISITRLRARAVAERGGADACD